MPLVKQTGVGARRNLSILCDVFLLAALLAVGAAPFCSAKIEAQVRLLNDDFTVPTRTGHGEGSSLEPTAPHYNLYKDDLKSISYETIHRILRDENEPTIYRPNDLRYFQKRSSAAEHVLAKRSLVQTDPGTRLNLNSSNLHVFPHEVLGPTRSLGDVVAINLHNNSLREFPLAALPNLTTLDLSANNFTHFEVAPANVQLRALNLNQNRIVNFTTLTPKDGSPRQHSGLHQLQLKDNSIRRLGQLNLSLLNELEVLDLSCNQLENLETAFFPTRMKNLKHLNLARNRLQCIYRETFYNLLSMNTLILSYNEITEIDYETFLALPNLQHLDLSHNRLRGDSIRALQGIPDLVGLSIAYNAELGSSMQEFVASWSLKELDASGTGLCKIPAALAQSVRTLKLADNWLTIISCGDLDSYPLLQYLDLSHSHIDEIEEDALGRLEILETLFLDHNNLKRIPISLPTSLENLFLQDNQIMDIQPQSFQGLNNLKTLDLSANQLLYLPDLPLPKLLTLNLQSSGISGLHQAIVKTSPHLRDLYLEDNPIKCADLLGIAEWASPCRNDRRITERINIKSHYVRMHNYFERFECVSTDPDTCATCATDTSPPGMSTARTNRFNCVDVNQPGTTTTKRPSEPLTQDGKNNEPPRADLSTAHPATGKSSLTRKTHTNSKSTASPSPSDANQDELAQTSPPATLATELTAAATTATPPGTAGSRMRTNSTDKISPLPQQKQLADESASPTPSQIKSDNNYVETSPGSGPTPHPTTTSPPQPSPSPSPSPPDGTLASQESTGSSHKGLKAQSDNATKTGLSKDNGEISEPTSSAKSNLPTTAVVKQQQGSTTTTTATTPAVGTTLSSPTTTTTTTTTTRATMTTRATTTTMMTMIIGQQHRKTESPKTPGQQHNKIQELLHTKDRHLIGTPLLMHKGHVVLVPPTFGPTTTGPRGAAGTMATTPKGSTQRLASRQDARAGNHGNGTTTITTSKGHKLEMPADDIYSSRHTATPDKQQGSSENAIIKEPRKKTTTNGPLGQENHYQDIQQHKLPYHDKKETQAQQKSKDNSTAAAPSAKDKNQRLSDKGRELDNQFATKSAHHHSLNTPLDGPIPRVERDELLNEIDGWQSAPTPAKDTLPHHSRVNTPLHEGHNLNADSAPESPAQSSANETRRDAFAALIKPETMPRTEPAQQSIRQHSAKSERWLDIRKATRHPGLVIVIGVTCATVFVVGLVQIYRYRQKPLSYIPHRHYGHQNEHHQHQQYHEQNIQDHQRHHLYHHQRHTDNDRNHNQCSSTYGSGDDRYATSPHHLLRIHEHPSPGPDARPLLLPPPPPPPASSSPTTAMTSGCSNYDSSGCTSNSTAAAPNYRLFQLNGKRIKHTHHSSSSTPLDDENAFYTEMNHGPQSELASDFFPMELLSAPSRMQHHHHHQHHHHPASSSSSSIVVPPLGAHAPPPPPPHAHGMTTVSFVGRQHQQQSQPRRPAIDDDDDFQDIAVARDRSKFGIW